MNQGSESEAPVSVLSSCLNKVDRNKRSLVSRSFAGLILIGLLAAPQWASAQGLYGTIDGNVVDPSGAAIPGAAVTATNQGTNDSRRTVTGVAGGYSFPNIQPGTYQVQVVADGFQAFSQTNVAVTLNSVVRVDIRLEIGAVTDTVSVEANAAVLQTDRSEVRHAVSSKELDSLPVPAGRNFQHTMRLLPGFSAPATNDAVRASNPTEAVSFNVNGTSSAANSTRIDGASSSNIFQTDYIAYVPSLEAIETVEVVTNSFDADTGLAGGSSVNVQIKSGTNDLHGSVFEYLTHEKTKALPFFFDRNRQEPKFLFNQFGGTLGGPIKRDKLFYFVSYEGTTDRRDESTFATVPTVLAKKGDMSESARVIYDPATGNTATGANRTPFLNNLVPTARQSSITAGKIVPLWPDPSRAGQASNYFVQVPFDLNRQALDTKFNWQASDKLSLLSRVSLMSFDMHYRQRFGFLGGSSPNGGQVGESDGGIISTTVAGTYLFTPTFIIDSYFGYTRQTQNVPQPDLDTNVGLDYLGIPGTNGPRRFEGGWPQIQIDGYDSVGISGAFYPWFRKDPQAQYVGNFNWIKGTHNVRFGGEFANFKMDHQQPEFEGQFHGASGGFRFTNGITQTLGGPAGDRNNAFASFLLGLAQNRGRTLLVPDRVQLITHQMGLYLRDRWNVTRNLTLNYGVRWEYYPVPQREDRGPERYDATTNKTLICGFADVPSDCGIHSSKKHFAPRFGLAYRVSDSFTIRTGYGISTNALNIGPANLRTNYPLLVALNEEGASTFLPIGRIEDGIPAIKAPDFGNGIIDMPLNVVAKTLPTNFPRGYTQSWNFTIEKALAFGFVGQAGYVATRQTNQLGRLNINAGEIPGAGRNGQPLFAKFGRTAETRVHTALGTSTYDSLQTKLTRRFSGGFQLGAAYTWSKAIGYTASSGQYGDQPPVAALSFYDRNRRLLVSDRPHTLHLTSIMDLPFGPGRRWANQGGVLAAIAGGWEVNNIVSLMSGSPFTATAAATSLNMPGTTQVADQVKAEVVKLGGVGPGQAFLDPLAFRNVTEPRLGTGCYECLRGPGVINWDFGLFRRFAVREGMNIEFRMEALNFTNTPHFSNPGGSAANMTLNPDGTVNNLGGFMEITSTRGGSLGRSRGDERNFRFGLRFGF